jgi:glycine cleavage system protein P-like pyridoxal-binding family
MAHASLWVSLYRETIMIEPTESEDKVENGSLCDTLSIRQEIRDIAVRKADEQPVENALHNHPLCSIGINLIESRLLFRCIMHKPQK